MTPDEHVQELDRLVEGLWMEVLQRPRVAGFITSPVARDRRTLAIYLVQCWFYAWHTSRNQGLVGIRPDNEDLPYLKYCFEHALEEVGHEQFALADLRGLGVQCDDPHTDLPPPVAATEIQVAYLYWVSTQRNPKSRLGYSFWAERAYGHGGPFLKAIQMGMGLDDSQLTFFTVHERFDEKHGDDVIRAMKRVCRTEADWAAVRRTAQTTMRLQCDLVEQTIIEAERVMAGEDSVYTALCEQVARG